ncbi:nucleolar protein NOP52 variant [Paraphaeosphaeria sporulosa]|uniref:Nucleolar protein NOP52 variant n=1 Tax=Paraphaeosphaeria sporulosa TaxID=1460663 RepID=A0A177D1V2_9PLEO|nr:nucleolar protein NOP52 variant [Paraphaeosphaeria sporulosa]OAG13019.1 nucleolar protein NOP52 variant [Paraphaeosphaeria sporulosa]
MADDAQSSPFIKHLASSDKRTRDSALASLRAFLSSRSEISELDLLKLWKGLFYCLWMQDKPAQQQALSRSLASLPSSLKAPVVLPFLRAFWATIAREWTNIEALRLDKYLYLIRQYVNASFRFLAANSWGNEEGIKQHGEIMAEFPLSAQDTKIPNGLRFHVLDVWVDELEKVEGEWRVEKRGVLEQLCAPVETLAKEGRLKVVRNAAKETLGDERLRAWRGLVAEGGKEDADMEDDEEEEWGGIED